MTIKSDDQMTAIYANTWLSNVNGNNYQIGVSGHYSITDDGKTIKATISSTTVPGNVYTGLAINFKTGTNLSVYNGVDPDWTATCAHPVTPTIKVSPKSLSFKSAGSKNLTVTLSNLTADVTVVSSNSALFEIDKTSIDKSTASTTVSVTCKTTESASETITFKSTGAEDVVIPVYFKTACDIPTIEADGYYFVIKGNNMSGLGGSYIHTCEKNDQFLFLLIPLTLQFHLLLLLRHRQYHKMLL